MKNWILKKKLAFITAIIGAIFGYLYWSFIGCTNGSCAITSVWYRTMLYGTLMGWLIGDFANDKIKTPENKQKDNE